MPTGPKKIENRGGYRPGSGRKKTTLSQRQVNAMLRKMRKRAKESPDGKDLDDLLLDVIYDKETSTRDFLAAVKLFKDFTMAKLQEKEVSVTKASAPVVLPERRPDPAKVVELKEVKK